MLRMQGFCFVSYHYVPADAACCLLPAACCQHTAAAAEVLPACGHDLAGLLQAKLTALLLTVVWLTADLIAAMTTQAGAT